MEQDDSQQITNFTNLDIKNIIFSETYTGRYSKYIPIFIDDSKHDESNENDDDDNIRKLIVRTPPQLYMSRINEQRNHSSNDITGYSMKMNLWNKKKGPTEEETEFIKKIVDITEYIKTFLRDIKEELEVTDEMINNFQILNYTTEDRPPTLYCKLMTNKSKKIMTSIWNESEMKEMNPYSLIGNKSENDDATDGLVTCALKIENILITEKRINVEIKVIEFLYTKIKRPQRKSLLNPNLFSTGKKNFKRNKDNFKTYHNQNTGKSVGNVPPPVKKKTLVNDNIYKVLDMDSESNLEETSVNLETSSMNNSDVTNLQKLEVI